MNSIGSASHLQTALGGAYLVERELGGGGMSRTYVARDTALERRVVIKVLSPDLAATVSHDRFLREILVSASLQHPNIVGILSAGEVDNLPYFIMPFVDGESLRMRLQRYGALSAAQVVSVLRDVARALGYAHERGIVHRDVKPDNVLLTAGTAVVADFGVSKALSSARETKRTANDATITSAGTALGTPAYMAPEQAAGDPNTDHRADIYAFGAMAYEMLIGEPPFAGRPPAQLLAAHITERPQHIAARRADIPRALAELVMRCLEKEPARRPQSAGEIALALEDPAMVSGAFASAPTLPVPAQVPVHRFSATATAVFALAAVALVTVGFVVARAGGGGDDPPADATVAALPADVRSIAVLPLVSLSTDTADAYLASGITDELSSALSRLGKFRVASRTAAQAAQQKGASPTDIGRELNVAYLLEGTVQRQGNRVRVTTRLVNASDGFTAWSDMYDRQTADLFSVQDHVARSVVDALTRELAGGSDTALAQAPVTQGTKDPQAYDHYLRGRALSQRRDAAGQQQALAEYQNATRRDSSFARAQAGIATVYATMPRVGTLVERAIERGMAAADAAVRLDTGSAEGYAARGTLHTTMWKFDEASKDLQRAVRLDPNNPRALQSLGELRLLNGDAKGAISALSRASVLDPGAMISSMHAMAHHAAGSTESALALARRATELDSLAATSRVIYGTLLVDAGRAKDAVRELEVARKLEPTPKTLGALGAAYAYAGDRAGALKLLAQLEEPAAATRAPTAVAKIKLALGDTDGALIWLARAADAHDPAFTAEPLSLRIWDPVRADPRFEEIVRRVGLHPLVAVRMRPGTSSPRPLRPPGSP